MDMTPRGTLALLSLVATACLACETRDRAPNEATVVAPVPSTELAPRRAAAEEIAKFAFTPTSFRAELSGRAVVVRLVRTGNELSGEIVDGLTRAPVSGHVDDSGEVSLVDDAQRVFTGLIEGDGVSGQGPDGAPFWLQNRFRDVPATLVLSPRLRLVPSVSHARVAGTSIVGTRPQLEGEGARLDDVNAALSELGDDAEPATPEGEDVVGVQEVDVSYEARRLSPTAFSLAEASYVYAGGAHGLSGLSCYVVDAATGEIASGRSLLDPRKIGELGQLLTKRLRAENDGVALSTVGFFEDAVRVSEATAVCPTEDGVRIVFQTYEVAPYAFGRPEITLSRREAARFFAPGALVRAFLG
jgi:hypothetical protein